MTTSEKLPRCILCLSEDHEPRQCPRYLDRDLELIMFGATLLVNTCLPTDYGQNVLGDFEALMGIQAAQEDDDA